MPAPEQQAVRTLLNAYWGSGGWRPSPQATSEQRRQAIEAGVMFDSRPTLSHDDVVAEVLAVRESLSQQEVADCFVASLSSRRLDLRSALGSFAVARHLQPHQYERGIDHMCGICGLADVEPNVDLDVMNFERFKWGGVRRDDLVYIWLDLRLFAEADRLVPSAEDRAGLERLLSSLAALPAGSTAGTAASERWPGIPSNKAERTVLLEILGVCSILENPQHPGFAHHFVRRVDRADPPSRSELAYPVCWWRSGDGVNQTVAKALGLIGK